MISDIPKIHNIKLISDPDSKRCHPGGVEREGIGETDRLRSKTRSRGPQSGAHGVVQLLQKRHPCCRLLRPEGHVDSGRPWWLYDVLRLSSKLILLLSLV